MAKETTKLKRTSSITIIGNGSFFYTPPANNKDELKLMRSQFGLFGGDNYRQALVNTNLEDAVPKQEDFLPFWFRHISATIVGGYTWKATEFPEKVLKKSTPMLSLKPVFVNHDLQVSNIIAGIGQTKWTNGFKSSDGVKVPPGIDAPIWVDGRLHPDICRKLAAFPVPHIQSVSVTVTYEWEPSHVFEDREGNEDTWLFESRIGQMVDGEMVRRVATEILEYYETSLVWAGADPFAKILNEKGEPINIEKSAIIGMQKFSDDPLVSLYKEQNRYFVNDSCFSIIKKIDLQREVIGKITKTENFSQTPKRNETNSKTLKMDELINFLAEKLNVKPEEVTTELLEKYSLVPVDDHNSLVNLKKAAGDIEKFKALKTAKETAESEVETLKADKTKLEGEKTTLETEKTENASLVTFATERLKAAKDEALRLLKLSKKGEEPDKSIVSLIERAETEKDFNSLNGMILQYGGKAFDTFEGKCNECGSLNIGFRSSAQTDPDPEGESFEFPNLSETFRK